MPREEVKDAAGLRGLSRKNVLCLLQGQDEKEGQNDDEECYGRSPARNWEPEPLKLIFTPI